MSRQLVLPQTDDSISRNRKLSIASVSTVLPRPNQPHHGIFVQRRLEELAKLADVRVVQPLPWFPGFRTRFPPGRKSGNDNLTVYQQPMFYFPKIWKILDGAWLERAVFPLLQILQEQQPLDLIDAHFGYPDGVGAIRAAESLGLPAFVTLRGNETMYLRHPFIGPQLRSVLKRCAGIITVSQSLKKVLIQEGLNIDKVRVIPNAVNTKFFFPASQFQARKKLGLPQNRKLIVSVGQLIHRKGYHVLIPALAYLKQHRKDVDLVIVGGLSHETGYPSQLENLIKKNSARESVQFVGAQPPGKIADWLRAADLFVLHSYREGCCNAILEALACGLPVVTTPVGDNAIYVRQHENGAIVPIDNEIALAEALHQTLDENWDREKIARNVADYAWPDVARNVLTFMNETVKNLSR